MTGLGFGMTFYLEDKFSNIASNISRSMLNLHNTTNTFTGGINREFQRASNLAQSGAASVRAAFSAFQPAAKALDIAGEFERGMIRLETLLGSAGAAQQTFQDIKKDALRMPMAGFKDLLDANALFISSGQSADKARVTIEGLANAVMLTGGTSQNLQHVAYNLNQILNNVKGSQQDIKQFAYNNLNFASTYKKLFGKSPTTEGEVVDYAKADQVFKYLLKNFNIVDRITNSLSGQMAMFRENVTYAMGAFGAAVSDVAVPALKLFNGAMEDFQEFFSSAIGKMVGKLAGISILIGSASVLFFGLYKLYTAISAFMMAGRIGFLSQITAYLYRSNIISKAFVANLISMKGYSGLVGQIMYPLIPLFARALIVFKAINSQQQGLVTFGVTLGLLGGRVSAILTVALLIKRAYMDWNTAVKDKFQKSLTGAYGLFVKIGGIMATINEAITTLTDKGFSLSGALATNLAKAGILDLGIKIGTLVYKVSQFLAGMADGFKIVGEVIGRLFEIFGEFMLFFYRIAGFILNIGYEKSSEKSIATKVSEMNTGKNMGFAFAVLAVIGLIVSSLRRAFALFVAVLHPIIRSIGAILSLSRFTAFIPRNLNKFFNEAMTVSRNPNAARNLEENIRARSIERSTMAVDAFTSALSRAALALSTGGGTIDQRAAYRAMAATGKGLVTLNRGLVSSTQDRITIMRAMQNQSRYANDPLMNPNSGYIAAQRRAFINANRGYFGARGTFFNPNSGQAPYVFNTAASQAVRDTVAAQQAANAAYRRNTSAVGRMTNWFRQVGNVFMGRNGAASRTTGTMRGGIAMGLMAAAIPTEEGGFNWGALFSTVGLAFLMKLLNATFVDTILASIWNFFTTYLFAPISSWISTLASGSFMAIIAELGGVAAALGAISVVLYDIGAFFVDVFDFGLSAATERLKSRIFQQIDRLVNAISIDNWLYPMLGWNKKASTIDPSEITNDGIDTMTGASLSYLDSAKNLNSIKESQSNMFGDLKNVISASFNTRTSIMLDGRELGRANSEFDSFEQSRI